MTIKKIKGKNMSRRLSILCAASTLLGLILFCIYGIVYDYFDTVVFASLLIGMVCALSYGFLEGKGRNYLNLVSVLLISYGFVLFSLNSYPVWADRLNHITMYGSRGTLTPVVWLMVLLLICAFMEIVSCFCPDEKEED